MKAKTLHTPRLIIRAFGEEDAEDLFRCCSTPELGDNAGWRPHGSMEDSVEILRTVFLDKESVWAIQSKESGSVIGSVGLMPDPKRENPGAMMIGYWLDREQWGRGFMTEVVAEVIRYAFSEMSLSLVSAYCYPHNNRSRKVIERAGFRYEGSLQRATLTYDHKVLDNLCFCLTREEYFAGSK